MTTQPPQDLLAFNGIDASTGFYLQPPLSIAEISSQARGEKVEAEHLDDLRARKTRETEDHYGVVEGVDPKDLSQTGWGVIFPVNHDPAIRKALAPLLDLRRKQASSKKERRYREYIGVDAYRPGESKTDFLRRHGIGPGVADPEKAPYYMLLVGDPQSIPYRFQYQLDVQYAVGRIAFSTAEEYGRYAQSVVAAETGGLAVPRRAVFFGTANPDDGATMMSETDLVAPLAEFAAASQPNWRIEKSAPEEATKARLGNLLGGAGTPALLFTASHGIGFPNGHPLQFPAQGALLCQDWPGPSWKQTIPPHFYFAGEDVPSNARILGLIAFHFACFGAGTPQFDDYAFRRMPAEIAPKGFVAGLPQRLLAHPHGGALAVIGHVERAWGYSFKWSGAGHQIQSFEGALKRLMEGYPVGFALEYFNARYAELASDLASELEDIKYGKRVSEYELAGMWTASIDARSYAVIGDPAVRLNLAAQGALESRPEAKGVIHTALQLPQVSRRGHG
jgi:hypothetical protein